MPGILREWYNDYMRIEEKELRLTKTRIEALHQLGISDTEELFSYYPIRYDILNSSDIETWQVKQNVTFEGTVTGAVRHWGYGKKTNVIFSVQAFDRILKITVFNRPWAKSLTDGQLVTIRGIYMGKDKVTATSYDLKPLSEHPLITPVYSIKAGIQQRTIRACMEKVYAQLVNEIPDLIPEQYIQRYRLLRKAQAIGSIHFPESENDIRQAYRTLKYEEFLKFFLTIQAVRDEEGEGIVKEPKRFDRNKINAVIRSLPFSLTKDQEKTLHEILEDLSSPHIMYRLVQGDVGCGKTVIAALALYACCLSGQQGALLAPTEILARQHYASLQDILAGTGCRIELLYAGLPAKEKKEILDKLENGETDIVIGTHSLLQEGVQFRKLGLVIADEQQRFGVEQRRRLKEKGERVDLCLMSATPIPRTLASTLYGDMDVSTIETLPGGRKMPVTKYIRENSFRSVLDDVNRVLAEGHQLYVICASVEKNEDYHARDVYETAQNLQKLFKDYKVGILHGKMSSAEKDAVMNRFQNNEIQVLVSTTVVEVGMNVVNATGMIIYDAERFGLSQLHQLRGRIRRGNAQGYCWLLSSSAEEKAQQRLSVLEKTDDGFQISFEDLRLRGPGDILGTKQAGVPDFILGNVIEDTAVIRQAQNDAKYMMENRQDPDFIRAVDWVLDRARSHVSFMD